MKRLAVTTCYLCGKPLTGDKRRENYDHVPPKQLLAKSLRTDKTRFVQLRTHEPCNNAYKLDEQYFTHAFLPFAQGSVAGNAVRRKAVEEYRAGEQTRLVNRVLGQAKSDVNGILLPSNKVWLDYEFHRIERVVGKIIKGVHFIETRSILDLPDDIGMIITLPGQTPPQDYQDIMRALPKPSQGEHQGVFAYRSFVDRDLHFWALLIWDRIIITAGFRTQEPAQQ